MASVEQKKSTNFDGLDLDDILPHIGEFGKYQKLLLWLVCLPACVPCGFSAFNQLFMTDLPDHWCRQPQLEHYSKDAKFIKSISIPVIEDNETYAKCVRYAVNWTELLSNMSIDDITVDNSWPKEFCWDGWIYNTTEIQSSIVIDVGNVILFPIGSLVLSVDHSALVMAGKIIRQNNVTFDLVCGKDIYPTIGLAGLNLGGPFGVYIFGTLNDRYGRRKSFFLCLFILIVGNILTALTTDFWSWAATRLMVGFTVPAIYQIPFIISLELVGPNYRSFVTVMTCLFYTLGLMLLAGVTYLIRDWRLLALLTSTPFALFYIYWWFLPESPRWLLSRGNFEHALKILETLARVNGKTIPDNFKQKIKQKMMLERTLSEERKLKKGLGISSLCRTPNMRLKTVLITLNCYYGPALGNDQYLSFLLSSLVEIPSYLFCWMIMDHWGRRWPLSIAMILSGISCVATVLLPPGSFSTLSLNDAVTLTLVLFLFSKFTISASFLIIYPFAGELYPTQIRGIGIGTSAYIAGLGLILIPFITYLGSETLVLPLVILGVISVFGGICSLRLPETLHHRLPQTIEEGEEFGNDWTIKECFRCIPIRPLSSRADSYEDLEMSSAPTAASEGQPEPSLTNKRRSIPRLVRQASIMETPVDSSGSMKITYWF